MSNKSVNNRSNRLDYFMTLTLMKTNWYFRDAQEGEDTFRGFLLAF